MTSTIQPCIALALIAPLALDLAPSAARAPRVESVTVQKKGPPAAVPFRPFVGPLDEARRSAAERNVPLLIHIVLEGETQNDEYRDKILPAAELQKLCERAVVIVSNNGEHASTQVKEEIDGVTIERPACSVYRWFESCAHHRETWDPLYFEYHEANGDMRCPQTVLLTPAAEVAWRFNTANPPPVGEVVAALERAQRAAGPGLTVAELAQVKTLVAKGRKQVLDGDHAGAWRSWQGVTTIVPAGTYGEEAKAGSEAALAALGATVQSALALLVPGQAAQGYARLCELDAQCGATPLEKRVKDAIKKAEKDSAIAGEIAAYKLELEAQALWVEGQALLADDARKAERVIRKLLRKKYKDTKTAATARERHPQWAAEETASGK